VHGVSHSEVFNSIWKVVDAVNSCDKLHIQYPESHKEKEQIARQFQEKSDARFAMCAGCIDGMLVWFEKLSKQMCKEAKCGPMKFMCGRKKKYGVNLQGVCDVEGRFLDLSIGHPASASDYVASRHQSYTISWNRNGF
jgi:hypothetical protein